MTTSKPFHFFVTFLVVLGILVISFFLGEFVVGKDATTGQIVIFVSILTGMILFYLVDLFAKRGS